jgi:hypothetical protein
MYQTQGEMQIAEFQHFVIDGETVTLEIAGSEQRYSVSRIL